MKRGLHIGFWILVHGLLTIIYGGQFGSYQTSFYFVSMLLPVVIATCYFFNLYLVPAYLFTKKYVVFGLYTIYMIVVSLYMEMVVIVLAFIFLAKYSYQNMGPLTANVFVLAMTLYFIVFLFSFIELVQSNFRHKAEIIDLASEVEKRETGSFNIRTNRKLKTLSFEEVTHIESLGDYVKIHLTNTKTVITKEKISSLESRLPEMYLRIHRSFLVNRSSIISFNREEVQLREETLPISRTYKRKVWEVLTKTDGSHRE